MAASPVYQRGKLVQFGFTNSHPDFTKGGDYMWSNSTNQAEEQPQLIALVIPGVRNLAQRPRTAKPRQPRIKLNQILQGNADTAEPHGQSGHLVFRQHQAGARLLQPR